MDLPSLKTSLDTVASEKEYPRCNQVKDGGNGVEFWHGTIAMR